MKQTKLTLCSSLGSRSGGEWGSALLQALLSLQGCARGPQLESCGLQNSLWSVRSQQHWWHSWARNPRSRPRWPLGATWHPAVVTTHMPARAPPCSLRSSAMGRSLLARRGQGHQPRFKVGKHTLSLRQGGSALWTFLSSTLALRVRGAEWVGAIHSLCANREAIGLRAIAPCLQNVTLTKSNLAKLSLFEKIKKIYKKNQTLHFGVLFWKIILVMYCPAHKNKLSSSKVGHFDLVYCRVLKLLPRNSWHHWPRISTIAAVGGTRCFADHRLESPGWTNAPHRRVGQATNCEHLHPGANHSLSSCSGHFHGETKTLPIQYWRVSLETQSSTHCSLAWASVCPGAWLSAHQLP